MQTVIIAAILMINIIKYSLIGHAVSSIHNKLVHTKLYTANITDDHTNK